MMNFLIALLAMSPSYQGGLQPISLIQNGTFTTGDTSSWGSSGSTFEVLNVNQPAFKHAARATFQSKPGGHPWDIALNSPSIGSVEKGRKVTIKAWLRSKSSSKMAIVFEQNHEPYAKVISKELTLTPDWKPYEAEGIADQGYAIGAAQLTIYLGYDAGSVDMANVQVETLGVPEPSGPVSLIDPGSISNGALTGWKPTAIQSLTTVSANQPQFTNAVRADYADKPNGNPWDVSLHVASVGKVKQGHTIYLRAWMRSAKSSKVSLIFEHASDPFTKSINMAIELTPKWQEYRLAGISDGTYGPGEAQFTVFLGYGAGSIEVGDVHIEDIGVKPINSLPVTVTYYSKPPSDAWRAPALNRIEKFRKGNLAIQVLDSRGKPVSGAIVHVDQVQQEFRFGTAVPAQLIAQKDKTGDNFRADLARFFNTVTFENDLKWHQIEPEDYSTVDAAIKWLDARGFRIRGHNLVWGSYGFLPKGLKDKSDAEISEIIRDRVKTMVSRFKGKLYLWDVVNEAVTEHELWDRIGWDKFVDAYKLARATDPKAELCYNDYDWTEEQAMGTNHRKSSIELVKRMIKMGAPIDVIGLQSHDGVPLTPMTRVIEITNELAKLGKPLEVTEYDLGVIDDKFNGEYMRDFLTAMYSVPEVQSFIMWGFWEGAHWRANEGGAMVRRDWSLRPAAVIWEDLVRNQWWTKVVTTTGANGIAKARAFYGTLKVTVTTHGSTTTKVVTLLPQSAGSVTLKL